MDWEIVEQPNDGETIGSLAGDNTGEWEIISSVPGDESIDSHSLDELVYLVDLKGTVENNFEKMSAPELEADSRELDLTGSRHTPDIRTPTTYEFPELQIAVPRVSRLLSMQELLNDDGDYYKTGTFHKGRWEVKTDTASEDNLDTGDSTGGTPSSN